VFHPLKKEKVMLKRVALVLILGVLFFASAQAEDFISSPDAIKVAQKLIQRNITYYSAHPEEAGNIPEWRLAKLGDPILVHTYPDLKPCYYVVPVINTENQIISLIGVGAVSREWQWFSRVQLEKFPNVSESQAFQVCRLKMRNAKVTKPKVVEMPNKKLYWLCLVDHQDIEEIFVNIDDALEIYTNLDPDISDLTAKCGCIQIHSHQAKQTVENPKKNILLYPDSYNIEMPFYYQETSWYCCEASLEMIFDYWGPDISQDDIGDAANDSEFVGTMIDDVRRASHFSYISTAIQNPSLQGYNERALGYSSNEIFWSDPDHYPDRYDDLKNLISNDYPVLVATWYSASHTSGHCRVLKGYNEFLNHFIVHDPWYSPPYSGPDVHFNQDFFVDDLWMAYDRWGLFSAPWRGGITVDSLIGTDQLFPFSVEFTYTAFHPFEYQFLADSVQATIYLPSGYQLVDPSSATMYFGPQYSSFVGDSAWQIVAPSDSSGPDTITVEMKGKVTGSSYSYPTYQDWIGGEIEAVVTTITYVCGDANRDGGVDIADVVYLINYLFVAGSAPIPQAAGDANHDFRVDIADAVYMINYLFTGGPPPCS
jgi:hypothetical protein